MNASVYEYASCNFIFIFYMSRGSWPEIKES